MEVLIPGLCAADSDDLSGLTVQAVRVLTLPPR